MEVGWAIPSPDGRYLALWQASGDSNVWMIRKISEGSRWSLAVREFPGSTIIL